MTQYTELSEFAENIDPVSEIVPLLEKLFGVELDAGRELVSQEFKIPGAALCVAYGRGAFAFRHVDHWGLSDFLASLGEPGLAVFSTRSWLGLPEQEAQLSLREGLSNTAVFRQPRFVDHNPVDFSAASAMLFANASVHSDSSQLLERLRHAEAERDYLRQELSSARASARLLSRATSQATSTPPDAGVSLEIGRTQTSGMVTPPAFGLSSLDEIPAWLESNNGAIAILPRALNGLKKSQYVDPSVICRCLEWLAGPYRLMRLGKLSKDACMALLHSAGVRLSGSAAPSAAGEEGDAYFVSWRGRRVFMNLHLLKGGGREPRYCLRIYFFWSEDDGMCVVGSMPEHLDNSLT